MYCIFYATVYAGKARAELSNRQHRFVPMVKRLKAKGERIQVDYSNGTVSKVETQLNQAKLSQ